MGRKWIADEKQENAAKLVVHAIGASGFVCTTLTALDNGLSVTGVSLLAFAILIEREVNARRGRRLRRPYILRDQTANLGSLAAQLRRNDHVVIAHYYTKGCKKILSPIIGAKDPVLLQSLSLTTKIWDLQRVLKRVDSGQIIFTGGPVP